MNFSYFDGKGTHDLRPKHRRKEILEKGIPEYLELDDSMLRNEAGEIDPELVAAEINVMSGFVVEQMWDDMRMRPDLLSKPDDPRIPIGEHFWQNFVDKYIEFDTAAVHRFRLGKQDVMDKVRKARKENRSPEKTWNLTQDEKMMLRWYYFTETYSDKSGSPSTREFIGIYTHLARVAGDKFLKQFKREPERDEYEHMLKDPSFQAMMTQMMMNSQAAIVWIGAYLIGEEQSVRDVKKLNTDMSRAYHLDFFEVIMKDDGPILVPNKPLLDALRKHMAEWLDNYKKAVHKSPKALRCPVVYTPIFKEMCDWMENEFSHHYLDQKYGDEKSSRETVA